MNKRQAHSTIEHELQKAGFARDDQIRRARIASAIVGTGAFFGEREAARLRAHFAQGYVGLAAIEAIEEALLDGSWVKVDERVREQERGQQSDPNIEIEPSHMRHVTEANPYGWRKPGGLRADDYDQPGEWNAYRQARNLSSTERREVNARDHRVRGCTRWDVLGNTKSPAVEFDAMTVAAATVTAEQVADAASTKTYGETP